MRGTVVPCLSPLAVGPEDLLQKKFRITVAVDRGAQIVANEGLLSALKPEASGWAIGIGQTFATDPTPLGWLGVAGIGAGGFAGQSGQVGQQIGLK